MPVSTGGAWGAPNKQRDAPGSDKPAASSEGRSKREKNGKSKENSAALGNVSSNLPTVGIWNSTESAAQRLKRLEIEKEKPKVVEPVPEAAAAEAAAAPEGRGKKSKSRERKNRKAATEGSGATSAAAVAPDDAPSASAPSSILENLSAMAAGDQPSGDADKALDENPKVGLKMGKWEAKVDRIEGSP